MYFREECDFFVRRSSHYTRMTVWHPTSRGYQLLETVLLACRQFFLSRKAVVICALMASAVRNNGQDGTIVAKSGVWIGVSVWDECTAWLYTWRYFVFTHSFSHVSNYDAGWPIIATVSCVMVTCTPRLRLIFRLFLGFTRSRFNSASSRVIIVLSDTDCLSVMSLSQWSEALVRLRWTVSVKNSTVHEAFLIFRSSCCKEILFWKHLLSGSCNRPTTGRLLVSSLARIMYVSCLSTYFCDDTDTRIDTKRECYGLLYGTLTILRRYQDHKFVEGVLTR